MRFQSPDDVADPVQRKCSISSPPTGHPRLPRTFIIDLLFTRPFAPAELKFSSRDRDSALAELMAHMGLDPRALDCITATAKSAERSQHGKRDFGKIALIGGGAMLVARSDSRYRGAVHCWRNWGRRGLAGAAALYAWTCSTRIRQSRGRRSWYGRWPVGGHGSRSPRWCRRWQYRRSTHQVGAFGGADGACEAANDDCGGNSRQRRQGQGSPIRWQTTHRTRRCAPVPRGGSQAERGQRGDCEAAPGHRGCSRSCYSLDQ